MNTKTYRFEIPSHTGFRNLTVNHTVTDLDPDGFTSDAMTGDEIIQDLAERNGLVIGGWNTFGADGAERMLVWENEADAENDDGKKAMCQIVRTPVRDSKVRMTETQAKQWVRDHSDDDALDEAELEAAFRAIFEREPDDEDREQGLWSHLCAAI